MNRNCFEIKYEENRRAFMCLGKELKNKKENIKNKNSESIIEETGMSHRIITNIEEQLMKFHVFI